ncbi:hypothetical protein HanXRQr2_Chr06g0268171 [Helianthus annuus]|uniref:Uncharacterized protein n=1 Tax=Helianthus annuus TaxID=4232 RepID=A0A9K3IW17_HELAN|nr:hypothetical protein HanXRQr2_Chr06g0268171 [Helianthus annuus]KAJ0916187.1 hypothetical protein HanPSC8_Chr06g0258761 [Helianthus annuus]
MKRKKKKKKKTNKKGLAGTRTRDQTRIKHAHQPLHHTSVWCRTLKHEPYIIERAYHFPHTNDAPYSRSEAFNSQLDPCLHDFRNRFSNYPCIIKSIIYNNLFTPSFFIFTSFHHTPPSPSFSLHLPPERNSTQHHFVHQARRIVSRFTGFLK